MVSTERRKPGSVGNKHNGSRRSTSRSEGRHALAKIKFTLPRNAGPGAPGAPEDPLLIRRYLYNLPACTRPTALYNIPESLGYTIDLLVNKDDCYLLPALYKQLC